MGNKINVFFLTYKINEFSKCDDILQNFPFFICNEFLSTYKINGFSKCDDILQYFPLFICNEAVSLFDAKHKMVFFMISDVPSASYLDDVMQTIFFFNIPLL